MSFRLLVVVTLFSGWLWVGDLSAQTNESTISAVEIQALVERLKVAEGQIATLQKELASQKANRLQPFPPSRGEELNPYVPDSPTAYFDERSAEESLEVDFAELLSRHQQLEANYQKLSESFSDFKGDIEKGVGIVLPGSKPKVIFNGRIHMDYWSFPQTDAAATALEGTNPQDRFGFRRVRFGAKGDLNDLMTYKVEMEFANPDDTEWRDVYIGFKGLPFLQKVLIGNQKRPYGLDHLNSSRYNVFLERPMFIDAFNDDSRRLGIVSYGISEDLSWNWRYGIYNGEKIQDSESFYVSDHYQPEIAGRIARTWWYDEQSDGRGYGHWAVSGTLAYPDGDGSPAANTARFRARPEARSSMRWINTGFIVGAKSYQILGLENVFNVGPLQLVWEAQGTSVQRAAGSDLFFWGTYGYISYFLTGEHMPWDRKTGTLGRIKPFENFFLVDRCCGGTGNGWGAWQIAARYSYTDLSSRDIQGGIGQHVTIGLNWYWNQNARMQFNYIHGWIDHNSVLTAAGFSQSQYDILGVRMMVDF